MYDLLLKFANNYDQTVNELVSLFSYQTKPISNPVVPVGDRYSEIEELLKNPDAPKPKNVPTKGDFSTLVSPKTFDSEGKNRLDPKYSVYIDADIHPVRKKIIQIALGELENGAGTKYKKYFDTVVDSDPGKHVHWCGIFSLWVLHKAGLLTDVKWKWGIGYLADNLPMTNDPKPGDIGYFDRYQHHDVLIGVDKDTITTVDGNGVGAKVTGPNKNYRGNFKAFFSIEDLLNNKSSG